MKRPDALLCAQAASGHWPKEQARWAQLCRVGGTCGTRATGHHARTHLWMAVGARIARGGRALRVDLLWPLVSWVDAQHRLSWPLSMVAVGTWTHRPQSLGLCRRRPACYPQPLGPCARAPGPACRPPRRGPSASAAADGGTKPRFLSVSIRSFAKGLCTSCRVTA